MPKEQTMRRIPQGWLAFGLLAATFTYCLAEELTLTTYYPSPRGVYQELRVSGNLGIGTGSPNSVLDVRGGAVLIDRNNTGSQPSSFGGALDVWHTGQITPVARITATEGAAFASDVLIVQTNNSPSGAYNLIKTVIDADGVPNTVFRVSGDGNVYASNMNVTGSSNFATTGGSVGIGTAVPSAQVHVVAPADADAVLRLQADSSPRRAVIDGLCNQVGGVGECMSMRGSHVGVELGRVGIESAGGDNHTGQVTIWASSSGTLGRKLRVEPNGNLIIAGSLQQGGNPDIAENIRVSDPSIAASHLVIADPDFLATAASPYERVAVTKSRVPYDAGLIGVVTSEPGVLLNADARAIDTGETSPGDTRPFVLTGRVPVRVSTENGPIAVGDRITSSSVPGIGMKATKAGRVIGIALTAYAGKEPGEVLVLVNAHTWIPDDALARLNADVD